MGSVCAGAAKHLWGNRLTLTVSDIILIVSWENNASMFQLIAYD